MNLSYLLVFLQFFFLSVIFIPFEITTSKFAWVFSILFLFLSLIILLWTSVHNRIGNFNIVPEIKDGCTLVKTGPYAFIRHPMYTSVVMIAISALIFTFSIWKIFIVVSLVFVLYFKAKREESFWCEKTVEYKEYKKNTKMFIPFVL